MLPVDGEVEPEASEPEAPSSESASSEYDVTSSEEEEERAAAPPLKTSPDDAQSKSKPKRKLKRKPKPKASSRPVSRVATAAEFAGVAAAALSAGVGAQLTVFNRALVAALEEKKEVEQAGDKIKEVLTALGALPIPAKNVVKNHAILPTLKELRKHDCRDVSAQTKQITACWQQLWQATKRASSSAQNVPRKVPSSSANGISVGVSGDDLRAEAAAPAPARAPKEKEKEKHERGAAGAASSATNNKRRKKQKKTAQLKPILCKRRRASAEMLAKCIGFFVGQSGSTSSYENRAAVREVRVCVESVLTVILPHAPPPDAHSLSPPHPACCLSFACGSYDSYLVRHACVCRRASSRRVAGRPAGSTAVPCARRYGS